MTAGKMPGLPKFAVGDKVRHKQLPGCVGEVVRVGKEVDYPGVGPARKVYWRGWNPYNTDKVDWTWDFALEEW